MRPPIPKRFLALLSLALLLSFVQNVEVARSPAAPQSPPLTPPPPLCGQRMWRPEPACSMARRRSFWINARQAAWGRSTASNSAGCERARAITSASGSRADPTRPGRFSDDRKQRCQRARQRDLARGRRDRTILRRLATGEGARTCRLCGAMSPAAPPTSQTWCRLDTLEDHFERHGADFKSSSSDHYAAQAWRFLQHARQSALPMKWDAADRTLRVWEPRTRTSAAYDRPGPDPHPFQTLKP